MSKMHNDFIPDCPLFLSPSYTKGRLFHRVRTFAPVCVMRAQYFTVSMTTPLGTHKLACAKLVKLPPRDFGPFYSNFRVDFQFSDDA